MTDLSKPEQRHCAKCGAPFIQTNKFIDQRLCASCGLESLRRFLESTDEPDNLTTCIEYTLLGDDTVHIQKVIGRRKTNTIDMSTDEPDKPFGILYHAMIAVSVYLIGAIIALVFYALTR